MLSSGSAHGFLARNVGLQPSTSLRAKSLPSTAILLPLTRSLERRHLHGQAHRPIHRAHPEVWHVNLRQRTSYSTLPQKDSKHGSESTVTAVIRPTISPSFVPFLSPSPTNWEITPAPPSASSRIRAAVADFYESGRSGDIAAVPHDAPVYRKAWLAAKELVKFYWNGSKLLWSNIKDSHALKSHANAQGWDLTRRELRFIERTNGDMVRLVPFAVIMATLEELLPILVLYAPWMLPSTCIMPAQTLRIKWDEEGRRLRALAELGRWRDVVLPDPEAKGGPGSQVLSRSRGVKDLEDAELEGVCQAMDLGTKAPRFWLRRKLAARLTWLIEDDRLLRRENNGIELTNEEKRMALSQRGMLSLLSPPDQIQRKLNHWLDINSPSDDRDTLTHEMIAKVLDEAGEAFRRQDALDAAVRQAVEEKDGQIKLEQEQGKAKAAEERLAKKRAEQAKMEKALGGDHTRS